MNTPVVIYLASIADPARGVMIGIACSLIMAAFITGMIHDINKTGSKWVWISLLILSKLFFIAFALTPDSAAIYKIAGVTDQQKASIDATGKVIQEGVKK